MFPSRGMIIPLMVGTLVMTASAINNDVIIENMEIEQKSNDVIHEQQETGRASEENIYRKSYLQFSPGIKYIYKYKGYTEIKSTTTVKVSAQVICNFVTLTTLFVKTMDERVLQFEVIINVLVSFLASFEYLCYRSAAIMNIVLFQCGDRLFMYFLCL